jgi:hypothetical protein
MAQAILANPFELGVIGNVFLTQFSAGTFGHMKLFQNNFNPTPASILADFTEATFDGYAAQVFKMDAGPTRFADGSIGTWNLTTFHQTGNTTPNTIYGCYLLDPSGALAIAVRFDTPVQMVDAFSHLGLNFGMGFSNNQITTQLEIV